MHQRLQQSETQLDVLSKLFLQLFTAWLQLSIENHNNSNRLSNQHRPSRDTNGSKKDRGHRKRCTEKTSSNSGNSSNSIAPNTEDEVFGTFGSIDAYRLISLLRKLEDMQEKENHNTYKEHGHMGEKRRRKQITFGIFHFLCFTPRIIKIYTTKL